MNKPDLSGIVERLRLLYRSKKREFLGTSREDVTWFLNSMGFAPYGTVVASRELFLPETNSTCQDICSRIAAESTHSDIINGDRAYHVNVYHPYANGLDGLRILHISDTHFKRGNGQRKKFEGYTSIVDGDYDLIIHTGDVVQSLPQDFMDYHLDFLRRLNASLGKYFVFGNHDIWNPENRPEIEKRMKESGFVDLTNISIRIRYRGREFNLIGVDNPLNGVPEFESALTGVSGQSFNILAIHCLDGLTSQTPEVFDIVLSGHIHSGEVNLGLTTGIDYLIMTGEYKNLNLQRAGFKFLTERTLSYINPGVQSHIQDTWGLPRIFAQRQGVTVMTLREYNPNS